MSRAQDVMQHAYELADGLIAHLGVLKAAGVPALRRDETARAMLPLARVAAVLDGMGQRLAELAAVPEGMVRDFDPARFADPGLYELRAGLRPVDQRTGR